MLPPRFLALAIEGDTNILRGNGFGGWGEGEELHLRHVKCKV